MRSKEQTEEAERVASRFIAQRETGPWSEQDAAELDQWLGQSTLNKVLYYRLNAAWHEVGRLKALSAGSSYEGSPRAAMLPDKWRSSGSVLRALAATAVLGTVLYFAVATFSPFDRYDTDVGGLESVPLADGSRMTLNTDSTVRVALSEQERRIDLQKGEAYFEVAKDPARPFVVTVGNQRVVAVGTKFSVRRNSNDELQVIVTEGVVRIEPDGRSGAEEAVLLQAGAIARSRERTLAVERKALAQAEQQLTWRAGVLTFRDTPLADAAAEFNRYNDRKIVIRDPAIAGRRIGGVFGVTQPEAFVRLIEDAFAVRVSEEEGTIVIDAK